MSLSEEERQEEILHLQVLIRKLRTRLRALEQQAARFGINVPVEIATEIVELEQQLRAHEERLAQLTADAPGDAAEGFSAELHQPYQNALPDTSTHIPCPYPGLVPFRIEDSDVFYGRDQKINEIIRLLRYHRVLILIGPSGCGKSSLMFAGVVPELYKREPKRWLVREMRTGTTPVEALAYAIENKVPDNDQGARDFTNMIQSALTQHRPAQELLLIIDQFEELFSQNPRAEQKSFISILRSLQQLPNCRLVLTIRADFYPELMMSDLRSISPKQKIDIVLLSGSDLEDAIVKPAAKRRVQVDEGLVKRLVSDAADEPGMLPFVQETMAILWGNIWSMAGCQLKHMSF